MRPAHCLFVVLAATAALHAAGAQAGNTRARYFNANPTSYCQTALPVFDGNVRKRPLAVQNEGGSNAFVTCSFTAQATLINVAGLAATNSSNAPVSLDCTAVTGGVTTSNEYVTKTVSIAAGAKGSLAWSGADFPGAPQTIPGFGLLSVSCNLAPGVGLNDSLILFLEDVGA